MGIEIKFIKNNFIYNKNCELCDKDIKINKIHNYFQITIGGFRYYLCPSCYDEFFLKVKLAKLQVFK